jgi:hypothetical protein
VQRGGLCGKEILTLGGRQKNYLRVAYDRVDLPILPAHHLLSRLYLEEAHRIDHAGVDAMVMRSRSQVWITQVRPKAKTVKNACFACKRWARRLGEQKMAPLPEHRMGPTPPFYSITPLHLQLGRATVEVPGMRFEEAPRLTQRLQFIEETKRQFWKKWMQQVFSGRMLNHKWT